MNFRCLLRVVILLEFINKCHFKIGPYFALGYAYNPTCTLSDQRTSDYLHHRLPCTPKPFGILLHVLLLEPNFLSVARYSPFSNELALSDLKMLDLLSLLQMTLYQYSFGLLRCILAILRLTTLMKGFFLVIRLWKSYWRSTFLIVSWEVDLPATDATSECILGMLI
jgi:hypothetical protein